MKINNEEIKKKMIQRLRRVEGQIRGVQSMLEEERDCREIMQQLSAVHSAVQSTSSEFFRNYAAVCLTEMDVQTIGLNESSGLIKRNQIIDEMITLLDKTP